SSTKDAITGKITTTGGTSLSNVASAGDYTNTANASKGVNAGDLNNAVIDAKTAVTNTGIKFGNGTTANQYKLGDTLNVKASTDGSITSTTTADGVQLGLGNTVKVGSGATQITVDGSTGKIGGLSNKTWNAASITSGQAATEDQLKLVSDAQSATDNAAVKYDSAATKDKVTLGGATGTTITNVKDGTLNASSTDAVNGRQLYATNQNVAQNTTSISTLNTTVSNHGTQITTNTADISSLKGGFTLQTNGTNAGAIKAGDTVDIGVADLADTNLTATKTGKDIAFALSQDLSLTSVTTGNTVINNAGLTADKVTVGNVVIDKTTNKITGIEAGTSSKDAVNKGQLDTLAAQQAATDSAAVKYDNAATKDKVTFGGTATSSTKDPITGKITSTGGTSLSNVASAGDYTDIANASKGVNAGDLNNAVINVKTAVTNTGIKFGNGTTVNQYKLGDIINVKASTDGSITSTTTADGVQLGLGNTVKVGSGATQITVDGSTGKIGGLSNKTWNAASITSGQAATEDQLKLVSDAQTATDNAAVKYDSAATKDKVTLGGGATGTTISNVKAGGVNASSSDAINGSQLHAVSNSIKNAIGGSTTINAVTGAITTNNIGGTGANTIDGAINSVSNTAKAAKTEVKEGDNIKVTSVAGADGQSIYTVATAQDVSFDKVTVGSGATQITLDGSTGKIGGLSNKTWNAASITSGQAATEDQLKLVSDAQTATDNAAVKYDNAATKDKVTFGGTATSSTKDAITGKITTTGGTSLSNVASAGDYTNTANASKGVNAGDLNNAVIDAKTAVTNTGIKFGNGTTANQYKLGDTLNVKASTDGSITSTTTADGVQLGLGNTVK
ncbi:hypothetical protein B9T30_16280, partial [Acinetobacter sp. ANC 4973]